MIGGFTERKKVTIPEPALFGEIEIEEPYFDKNGKEIKEFAVIKMFHFKGVNDQGRGRKNYYMYKWVRLKESKGKLYWIAYHLTEEITDSNYFYLGVGVKDRNLLSKEDRILKNTEIVQQYD